MRAVIELVPPARWAPLLLRTAGERERERCPTPPRLFAQLDQNNDEAQNKQPTARCSWKWISPAERRTRNKVCVEKAKRAKIKSLPLCCDFASACNTASCRIVRTLQEIDLVFLFDFTSSGSFCWVLGTTWIAEKHMRTTKRKFVESTGSFNLANMYKREIFLFTQSSFFRFIWTAASNS